MKVAFFVNEFPTISETFILNQIAGLIDRGVEISIFPLQLGKTKVVQPAVKKYKLLEKTSVINIPQSRLVRWSKFVFLLILAVFTNSRLLTIFSQLKELDRREKLELFFRASAIKNKEFDIIQASFGPNGRQAVFLRRCGILEGKIVVSFLGYDLSRLLKIVDGKKYYAEVFKEADLLLPLCRLFQKKLISLGASKEKIEIHHLGISPDDFGFLLKKPGDILKILTVSRLVPKKGIDYGLRALAKVINKLNFEYQIIGDGSEKKRLIKLVKQLKLSKRVEFLGQQTSNQARRAMKQADIFLLPSVIAPDGDMEGTPVSLMEAMASGLMVISTNHSGIPELIKNKEAGFLCNEKDVDCLARTFWDLFKNRSKWDQVQKRARLKIEKDFNINKLNDRLLSFYKSLINEKTIC